MLTCYMLVTFAALCHALPSQTFLKIRAFLYQEEVIQLWVHSRFSILIVMYFRLNKLLLMLFDLLRFACGTT
jgi:hypothetical protein